MTAHEADDVLATVLDVADALDLDDFERVERHLDADVVYVIGDVFHHHSIQDITVKRDRRVTSIVDRPVDGQRAGLDEFMARHARTR